MSKTLTYLLLAPELGLVKIGCSANPMARLRRLRTLNAARVEILAVIDEEEGKLHEKFARLRDHGEWFRVADCIGNYLFEIGEKAAAGRIYKVVNDA